MIAIRRLLEAHKLQNRQERQNPQNPKAGKRRREDQHRATGRRTRG
jgi:hypothetical protein